jgi:hypothetical protein
MNDVDSPAVKTTWRHRDFWIMFTMRENRSENQAGAGQPVAGKAAGIDFTPERKNL